MQDIKLNQLQEPSLLTQVPIGSWVDHAVLIISIVAMVGGAGQA